MIYNKYMLEFMSFLTKNYPNFHVVASIKTMKNIMEQFDTIFNEENRLRVLNKKQSLIDKGYIELYSMFKENIDFVDKFYNTPHYVKTFYLDIQTNHIDKNFIIYKENKN